MLAAIVVREPMSIMPLSVRSDCRQTFHRGFIHNVYFVSDSL